MNQKPDDAWFCNLANYNVEQYRLIEYVGRGRIGYVYKAELNDVPGSEFAVKLVFSELKPGWEVELRKVIKLQLVEGVVHFHGLGTSKITHRQVTKLALYTVWDYISPGENLRAYLRRVGAIQTSFLLAVVERVLRVLHACREKGVIRHGDLHSGNILIGEPSGAILDDSLQQRAPIYVSDFGYGATGAAKSPKNDYEGLAKIINEMIPNVNYATATATDRQIMQAMQRDLGKLLNEHALSEQRLPLEMLRMLDELKRCAQSNQCEANFSGSIGEKALNFKREIGQQSVGQFQVSEMIGDRWDWWQQLFVPNVPARSKILAVDIPTVVTGPRGCGKTMLFRRLSERLIVECGEVQELSTQARFVALYVNANDFADAFSHFPEKPSSDDEARLICYANLCILADLLAVLSARSGRKIEQHAPEKLLGLVKIWLINTSNVTLIEGEDKLERYRTILEQIKWKFPSEVSRLTFPGFHELSQRRWLPYFVQQARLSCPWMGDRSVLLFIDDYSTPRVSSSMQRVLNRLFLQRSNDFLAKVATEASSTFVAEDSSGKNLQDGDDYQLVDMGEESLFLPDHERLLFLNEVFSRRLPLDQRIPKDKSSLADLLGIMPLSKTEFARRLRGSINDMPEGEVIKVDGDSQRRGRSRARVHYYGENIFSDLWSGDTRTMIQLISDVVDQSSEVSHETYQANKISIPVNPELQDRVFRNRGGEWLDSHTRNEPTDPYRMRKELALIQKKNPNYKLRGDYGSHLKAVVEAFVASAKQLLLGPMYTINEGGTNRDVPRMAFRLEIVDEFRIDGLAQEIYRDLIRYGLFMRDNRGKSVRGTFVPRLYMRRLLLPFCTLALSKRDSVQVTCEMFIKLLLEPDVFKDMATTRRQKPDIYFNQLQIPFPLDDIDPAYDDIDK